LHDPLPSSIGMVRAGSMISTRITDTPVEFDLGNPAPTFIANADQQGDDGTIDLIDVKGDCGGLGNGGPSLYTGPNGNVRYMRVGLRLYASNKFGSGLRQETPLEPGEEFRFTDDSGTRGVITPGVNMRNPNFDGV